MAKVFPFTDRRDGRQQADVRTKRTRAALLQALNDLLQQRAYADVTSADLADAAGVTRATLYTHFPSKDDLMSLALNEVSEALVEKIKVLADWKNELPRAVIQEAHEIIFDHVRAHLPLYRAALTDPACAVHAKQITEYCNAYARKRLTHHVLRGRKPTMEMEFAAYYVVSGLLAVMRSWIEHGARKSPRAMAELTTALVLGASYPLLRVKTTG